MNLIVNGIHVTVERGAAPARKWCKFCVRRELAVTTCNHIGGDGKLCGNGICQHHTIELGPDLHCCPLHNPDRVYLPPQPAAEPVPEAA